MKDKKIIAMIAVSWLLLAGNAIAQVNIDAYRDYFLVGQFGEVCTMCEVIVLCETGDTVPDYTEVPAQGSFTLYHLQTRTFWSQVSTIWEWFISNFTAQPLAKRGHTRPVHVYTVDSGQWAPMQVIEAQLILDPGVLEFGATNINRVNRQWLDASTGEALGYCERLPLWESLDAIKQHSVEGAGQ
jgi:hypothetical protein